MGTGKSFWHEVSSCSPAKNDFVGTGIIGRSKASTSSSRPEPNRRGGGEDCSCHAPASERKEAHGNPEVLTPRNPYREPYAIADGPDGFAHPIHDSLEPRGTVQADRFFPTSVLQNEIEEASNDASLALKLPSSAESVDEASSSRATDDEDLWPMHLRAYVATCRHKFRLFLHRAELGIKCRILLRDMSNSLAAMLRCHMPSGTLRFVACSACATEIKIVRILGICSICMSCDAKHARMCVGSMQFDTSDGAFQISLDGLDRTSASDDFLDCIAILVCVLRCRARDRGEQPPIDSTSACPREELRSAWEPGDVHADRGLDMLRPHGKSLDAAYMTGHAGALLAAIGEPVLQELRGNEAFV